VILPDNPVEQYDMVNINTLGIGTYDSTEGTTFQMRGIYSANASLTVTLDAANGAILLTLDTGSIIDDLPQATTTQRGVGETATDAEAIAKASTTVFVTPNNFAAMASSQTFAGFIEIATNAEALAGASALLAITPASLAAVVATLEQTTTFADAVARAAAVPAFDGQFGTQLDINAAYVATGVGAGNWIGLLTLGSIGNELTAATTVDLNTFAFTLNGGGTFSIDTTTLQVVNNTSTFNNGTLRFGNSSALVFDWGASTDLNIAGVQVPAASVLVTAGAGVPSSRLLNTILSTANTQPYGAITGGVSRSPYTVYGGQTISNPPTQGEVQALDDAVSALSALVGAVVTDLKNTQKPDV
jgi:hypothetical protein